jgi:Putative phage serine protease XkdF
MKTKAQEATERGNALLAPVDASVGDVESIEFSLARFSDAAAAKTFAKNHGLPVERVTSVRDGFVARVRELDDFEPGTLTRAIVGRSRVTVSIGTRKAAESEDVPADPAEVAPEFAAPEGREVTFAKSGEVWVARAKEGDPEDSVRMFGVVMMPEVPDSDGIVTSAEEIESANFGFMKDFQVSGFMHTKNVTEVVKIIQNVIAPVDIEFPLEDGTTKAIAAGTWYQELYTDDPDLVGRVRKEQITGLSIGGFAKEVPITQMQEGGNLLVVVPENYSPAMKRAIEEAVAKAEGDPALARFVDLRVQEVSLVDAAANQEDFFIIKRRTDMDPKQTETAAATTTPAPAPPAPETKTETPPTAPEAPAAPAPAATTAEPTVAEQIQAGIDAGVKAALAAQTPAEAPTAPEAPAAPPAAPEQGGDAVAAALTKIGERLDGIEAAQKEAGVARAVARGANAPEETATPSETPEADPSPWAGTAIHSTFGKGRPGGAK